MPSLRCSHRPSPGLSTKAQSTPPTLTLQSHYKIYLISGMDILNICAMLIYVSSRMYGQSCVVARCVVADLNANFRQKLYPLLAFSFPLFTLRARASLKIDYSLLTT